MRILFVAMPDSIHTARWINQISDEGWDIHLFPVNNSAIHPELRNIKLHNYLRRRSSGLDKSVKVKGFWPISRISAFVRRFSKQLFPWFDTELSRTIRKLKPDIIHSLEIQHAGYMTLDAYNRCKKNFPAWIVTNWGSDIYLFGRLSEHTTKIKEVLNACNYYDCECLRDVDLAYAFGFKGEVLPVLPNTGGFHIKKMLQFRQNGSPSARRLILLKGYQNWSGRALVGLRAIELSADVLKEYHVAVYSACKDVQIAAEIISLSTGIKIEIISSISHEEMLRLHGKARVSIGLSISDAASISMLEAMVMGSFPIQSCTACADEWIQNGITGLIVPPEDPEPVAAAIRLAVTDDDLVDKAAGLNTKIAFERLDYSLIQKQVINVYEKIVSKSIEK